MNDPNPSSNRVNFPKSVSAGASERQTQYRGRAPGQGSGANQGAASESNADANTDTDALVLLVQELTQQNHALSSQVRDLETALAADQGQPYQSADIPPENAAAAQVTYLLNQLEFAQQANQRQAIRIENLAQQVNADRMQLVQLEQDSQAFQKRCRAQSNRIEQLEQRCGELQQRLQRQQRYTLQFKTALDKCLEVPPPSYACPDADTVHFAPESALTPEDSLTSLVSPMLPKVNSIPAWSQPHSNQFRSAPAPNPSQTDPLDPSQLNSVGPEARVIKPLKPELQVPQMSRFKTALFSLAHQPSAQVQAPPAQAEPQSERPAESPAKGLDTSSPSTPSPSTPEATVGPTTLEHQPSSPRSMSAASGPAASGPATTESTSEDDAFWSDLVQLAGTVDLEPSPAPQPRPADSAIQTPSPPSGTASSQRTTKSRGASEGVETLFDVVLQGAKAIASQLMPSEEEAATSPAASAQRDAAALPVASGPEAPKPAPIPNNSASPAAPPVAAAETTPDPSPETSSPLPQTSGPAPRLSQQTPKRDRIDLPTFLRPQPQ
ncbi:MAG: hypothetical protein ACFB4J_08125 [Elainellaceae cyanobacterium]